MSNLKKWLLGEPKDIIKSGFTWNTIGSFVFAISTMILTIVANRILGDYSGGEFAMALATGQLMVTIGYFETRTYQVTDTIEKYTFSDYHYTKIITNILMIICSIIYVILKGFSFKKSFLAILFCLFKMMDAYADVFEGEFQLKNRLDISGKSLTFRTVVSTLVIVIVLMITRNMYVACVFSIISCIFVIMLFNVSIIDNFSEIKRVIVPNRVKDLMIECFPLFISTFMSTYILNASRYAIEANLTSNYYSCYTAIFLPISVINLCIGIIFKPMLTSMAVKWNDSRYSEFIRIIVVVGIGIVCVTGIALLGAYILGIPVLSFLYNTDLSDYKIPLLILLVGGGLNSANVIFYYLLSVMRKQKLVLISYVLSFVFSLIVPDLLTKNFNVIGASISFLLTMMFLFIVSSFFVFIEFKRLVKH